MLEKLDYEKTTKYIKILKILIMSSNIVLFKCHTIKNKKKNYNQLSNDWTGFVEWLDSACMIVG